MKKTLAALILAFFAITWLPAGASSLDGLTDLVAGESIDAGLSELGLSAEQIEQAKPILEKSMAKGKEIMDAYNYTPGGENTLSDADLTKMKGELGEQVTSSKSLLGEFLSPDMLEPVMSLLKSQLSGGLL